MELKEGQTLGSHYEVIATLGEGGMGEVYRARDLKLDREVAIKILPRRLADKKQSRERFEREAKALAGLNHSNILAIYDFGDEAEVSFAVTELLEGKTIRDVIRERAPLPVHELLDIATQAARGLAVAHGQHIVHRDIKPENLFLTERGEVKVLDFGLARSEPEGTFQTLANEDGGGTVPLMTTPGTILGTIGYMAPEQARGETATAKSDVFSLGCVLYELATGKQPFARKSAAETLAAVINETPAPLKDMAGDAPVDLISIIEKSLAKEPEGRYSTAAELEADLTAMLDAMTAGEQGSAKLGIAGLAAAAAVLAIGVAIAIPYVRKQRAITEARQVTVPRVVELIDAGEYVAAFDLGMDAKETIPDDPILDDVLMQITNDISVHTVPAGASVAFKPYGDVDGPWRELGETPIDDVRLPEGIFRWRIEKDGYEPLELGRAIKQSYVSKFFEDSGAERPSDGTDYWNYNLTEAGGLPEGMVFAEGGKFGTSLTGFSLIDLAELDSFYIDRTEVTNAEFKKFVIAGGYTRPEYWKEAFVQDGEEIQFAQAIRSFVDSTGQPGPSTWIAGDHPEGKADHPVSGVSWFEAAAYARFVGKRLPTLYDWVRAAIPSGEIGSPMAPEVVPLSNFASSGTRVVGAKENVGPVGAVDLAGNVREWCWNASGIRRYALGGAAGDPVYTFGESNADVPWSRDATKGFRCVKYVSEFGPRTELALPIEQNFPDYGQIEPAPDQVIAFLAGQAEFDPMPLRPKVEGENDENPYSLREDVTIDAVYRGERIILHIDLPRNAMPPYQPVVFLSGVNMVLVREFSAAVDADFIDFVMKSGRALIRPEFSGAYSRNDGSGAQRLFSPRDSGNLFREWRQDMVRTLDYMETRPDLDMNRVAYLGMSLGALAAPNLASEHDRFDAMILISGGFPLDGGQPGVLVAWANRATAPTLMLNGRYDFTFPLESHQKPLYEQLGAAPGDKRHVVYETGHSPLPWLEVTRESLAWMDKYLGPTKRIGQ